MMRHQFSSSTALAAQDIQAKPDLPSMIAARICHDLISPLGAIGNGLELLELANATPGSELGLVRDSVQQAQARIRLFRIAFGAVQSEQTISSSELGGLLRDYKAQLRFDLEWDCTTPQSKPLVKLGLLALLCLERCLPHGGRVLCTPCANGLHLTAQSDRPKIDGALWSALQGCAPWPDDLRAAHVQFPLLQREIATWKMTLDIKIATDGVDMRILAD